MADQSTIAEKNRDKELIEAIRKQEEEQKRRELELQNEVSDPDERLNPDDDLDSGTVTPKSIY